MIKTLKWIYNRGRAYERMRLKRIATEFINESERYNQRYVEPAARDQEAKKELEINKRVVQVLQKMIYPDPDRYITSRNVEPIKAVIDEPEL
jgi:hypothetical protein